MTMNSQTCNDSPSTFWKYGTFCSYFIRTYRWKFPIWLIPEQVNILTISEKHEKYAQKVLNLLENNEIRALIDDRNETIGKKIRDAEVKKIPFMIIVGEKEEKT